MIDIGIAIVGSIVVLVASTLLARVAGGGTIISWITQKAAMSGLAWGLFALGIVGFWGAVVIALVPTILRVIGYAFLFVMSVRALRGGLGKETQWAAELMTEGDEEFITATRALPKHELRECAIIAESKEGLRDVVVERYEELRRES